MTIFQHTWEQIIEGNKTQTRRLVRPSERLLPLGYAVVTDKRAIWEVGKTYAIQPGRGQKSIGRIEITSIRREDVRLITLEDVKAEGFYSLANYLSAWLWMHDKPAYAEFCAMADDGLADVLKILHSRPDKRYDAWALTFKLIAIYPTRIEAARRQKELI